MRRKVIQLAGKTLLVSLPQKWAKKNNVRKGEEIEVVDEGDKLSIISSSEPKKSKITLKATEHMDKYTLAYLYQAGVDEIEVSFDHPNQIKEVKQKLPELMGFEIVDQSTQRIVIKSVTSTMEDEFDTMLRRVFYIIQEAGETILEAIKTKDEKKLEDAHALEDSIDKFTDFCKRILSKRNDKKSQFLYVIARDLEKIGDHYMDLNLESKPEEIEKINSLFKAYHEAFYTEKDDEFLKRKKEKRFSGTTGLIQKLILDLYGPLYILRGV